MSKRQSTMVPQPQVPQVPPTDMDVAPTTSPLNIDQMHISNPSTNGTGSFQAAGSVQTTPPQPMGSESPFQRPALRPKEFVCEYYDLEVATKTGVVLQYINGNSPGATCMIGMTRIGGTDPRKIPLYLSRHTSVIRQHAVAALQRHFRHTLCATGATEKLCPDDFSISFSWASVTEAGRNLHPHGRPDLCLGYAGFDQLVAPIWLSSTDPHPSYVVNVFIYLQEPTRRSTTVIQKAKEEETSKAEIAKRPIKVANNRAYPPTPMARTSEKTMVNVANQTAVAVVDELYKRTNPAPYEVQYPHLPIGSPPEWNKTGRTTLPDM